MLRAQIASAFCLLPSAFARIHCLHDFCQRRFLGRIQRQWLGWQDLFAGIGIAFGNLRGNLNQTAVLQFADGGGGGFARFKQFLQRQFTAFLDNIPDACCRFGSFGNSPPRQCPDKQPFAPASLLLAHGLGQDAFEGGLRRATVIIPNPARQLQDFRRDERLRADDFENGFEPGMGGFLGQRGDHAQNFPRPERNLHPAANVNLVRQAGRNQIIELLAKRDFKADAGNHAELKVEG